jgi:DNA-binding NarL/FixJ family response regulator
MMGMPGQQAADMPIEGAQTGYAEINILVVDDNVRYRGNLQHMIGKVCPQATIYEAGNVDSAVHLAKRLSPRLILIDVVLGDEDGLSCARRIKAISPQTRIVLISAYPDREFHRLGLEAGAVAFLDKKDLDLSVLKQVINDIL